MNSDFLTELQLAHLKHIHYENFDIINKKYFELDTEKLFEKLIINKRGGYCYEINILFNRFLKELGFKSKLIAAQIVSEEGIIGPAYDHPLILVELEEKWIADPGNSIWFTKPLNIDSEKEQIQSEETFVIKKTGGNYKMYQKRNEKLILQYQFNLIEAVGEDFKDICHYKWTSPDSKFTKGYIISKFDGKRRIVLKNDLIVFNSEKRITCKRINNKEVFNICLSKYFGKYYTDLTNLNY